jgi:putative tricarboxylic transport membrane protein
LGTLVGVLPGLGPAATMAILLPLVGYLPPTGSIIMLAGIYYGAQYGGSTTSILMNVPGEPGSAVTCLDGFQMTKQGRAGEALAIAAIGSFIAGTGGVILLSIGGPILADFALTFGPPEYFALVLFGMTTMLSFAGRQILKGIITGLIGIIVAAVGLDPVSGNTRLAFGIPQFLSGMNIIPVLMGLFGVAEVLVSAEEGIASVFQGKLGKMLPQGMELKKGLMASTRGSIIGLLLGLLPGMITSLTTFIVYDIEKRFSKYPERFGTGVIEGVASPEAANNATAQAGFIPLMAIGIPTAPIFGILLAALIMLGLTPGPLLFKQHADFAWAVIASMYIGNVMLLIINLPLVGLWARLCLVPYRILAPLIFGLCFVGAYSLRNNMFDVWICIAFGILGFIMRKQNWPIPPMILGVILGDMFEQNLRAALQMSDGSLMIFIERPIALTFVVLTILSVLVSRKLWSAAAKS